MMIRAKEMCKNELILRVFLLVGMRLKTITCSLRGRRRRRRGVGANNPERARDKWTVGCKWSFVFVSKSQPDVTNALTKSHKIHSNPIYVVHTHRHGRMLNSHVRFHNSRAADAVHIDSSLSLSPATFHRKICVFARSLMRVMAILHACERAICYGK